MADVDTLFDPATGQRDPAALASGAAGPASDQSGDAVAQALYDRVREETDRVRTEVQWFVEAWKTAGDVVARRLSEWSAASDTSVAGVVLDLAFVFLLESPAMRQVMERILRGAGGLLGKLILQKKAKISKIEDFAALYGAQVAELSKSDSHLAVAREAEQAARKELEALRAEILTTKQEVARSPVSRTGLPDRTPRFDFGASNVPDAARRLQALERRNAQKREFLEQGLPALERNAAETRAKLLTIMADVNTRLAKDLARARKEVNLAQSVQRVIELPESLDYAMAAANVGYKPFDPSGYDVLANDGVEVQPLKPGRRSSIPIDVALVDSMKVLTIQLNDEMNAVDRAAAKYLRDALSGDAQDYANNCISLCGLLLDVQYRAPAPEIRNGVRSLSAPQLEGERTKVIKSCEEILWAWVLYEPYFKPQELSSGVEEPVRSRMLYDPAFLKYKSSGSDWPPKSVALDYLYDEFVAPADDGWLEQALDISERVHRALMDVLTIPSGLPFVPNSASPRQKTTREAEIIAHFRKLHDASLAPLAQLARNAGR